MGETTFKRENEPNFAKIERKEIVKWVKSEKMSKIGEKREENFNSHMLRCTFVPSNFPDRL